jgi:hypothetical protein
LRMGHSRSPHMFGRLALLQLACKIAAIKVDHPKSAIKEPALHYGSLMKDIEASVLIRRSPPQQRTLNISP